MLPRLIRPARFAACVMLAALAFAGPVAAAGCAEPPASVAEVTDSADVRASTARKRANRELARTVEWWEAHGGNGRWFRSSLPWEGWGEESFYVITRVAELAIDAPVFLLRTENTRDALVDRVEAGVAIALGEVSPETFNAAAFGEGTALRDDAARALERDVAAVIVVGRQTQKTTLAHETRHHDDFADTGFVDQLVTRLGPVTAAANLSEEDLGLLVNAVWEWRGHAAGELDVLEDVARGRLVEDRAGNVVVANALTAATQANGFVQGHLPSLRPLLTRLREDAEAHEAFLRIMEDYDVAAETSRLRARSIF